MWDHLQTLILLYNKLFYGVQFSYSLLHCTLVAWSEPFMKHKNMFIIIDLAIYPFHNRLSHTLPYPSHVIIRTRAVIIFTIISSFKSGTRLGRKGFVPSPSPTTGQPMLSSSSMTYPLNPPSTAYQTGCGKLSSTPAVRSCGCLWVRIYSTLLLFNLI